MLEIIVERKERHSINTSMVYSDVKGTHKFAHAKLYNFNKKGLLFETDEKLIPGSEIVVEITNYMPGPYSPEGSDSYTAMVKWCEPTEDSEGYSVGAEITGNCVNEQKNNICNPCEFPFDGLEH